MIPPVVIVLGQGRQLFGVPVHTGQKPDAPLQIQPLRLAAAALVLLLQLVNARFQNGGVAAVFHRQLCKGHGCSSSFPWPNGRAGSKINIFSSLFISFNYILCFKLLLNTYSAFIFFLDTIFVSIKNTAVYASSIAAFIPSSFSTFPEKPSVFAISSLFLTNQYAGNT